MAIEKGPGPKPQGNSELVFKALVCNYCSDEETDKTGIPTTVKTWHGKAKFNVFASWVCGICGSTHEGWFRRTQNPDQN